MNMNQRLADGTIVKQDVIRSFLRAIKSKENFDLDGAIIWDFVSADMVMDLGGFYNFTYIDACLDHLADQVQEASRQSVMEGV